MEINGNGRNGTWRNWVIGIAGALIIMAVAGEIVANREIVRQLAEHEERLRTLDVRLNERTVSRFTREDADRELRSRDVAHDKLESRVLRLEQMVK